MSNFGVVKQLQMNNLVPAGGKPAAGSTSGRGSNNAAPPVTSPRTPAAAAAAPAAKAVPKQLKPPTAEEAAKTGTRGCWLHVQFKGKKWDHRLCFLYEHLMCFYTGHKDPAPTYVIKLDKWAHIELPTGNCDKPNSLAITGPGGNYMLAFSCIQDTHAWLKSMTANQKEYLQKNSK